MWTMWAIAAARYPEPHPRSSARHPPGQVKGRISAWSVAACKCGAEIDTPSARGCGVSPYAKTARCGCTKDARSTASIAALTAGCVNTSCAARLAMSPALVLEQHVNGATWRGGAKWRASAIVVNVQILKIG